MAKQRRTLPLEASGWAVLARCVALVVFSFSGALHAEEGIQVSQVRNNIYLLVSPAGGNVVAMTGTDGVFMVDTQLPGRSAKVEEAISEVSSQPIRYVLNTHYHSDHTGGNTHFGDKGPVIIAQENVRKRLSNRQFISYFNREMLPLPKVGLPSLTFTTDMTLYQNGEEIRLFNLSAAHTDGDAGAFFANANVLVTGDTVSNGSYPFIDVEHGGSIKGMLKAAEVFLSIANEGTTIIPGHGQPMNKTELQAYHDMIATIEDRIETAVEAGKTLEQVLAAKPTQEFDAKMKKGIVSGDALTNLAYEDLAERRRRRLHGTTH
ncbi:MAG TPA: MBL fold metallo-hydrolase [Methylophilaceae bacterium]|nr:MBL fold metallo-hydrolase [Methylophilaceae bacterium]